MGPAATIDFLHKLVAATPANADQDHIRLLIDHNPTLPNRHDAIAGRAPSLGPALAAMAQGLERSGAELLVMVCNTAHAYTDEIRAAVAIPFVSIVEVSVAAAVAAGKQRVGLMAAEGCLQSGVYQRALIAAGLEPVLWSDAELARFMALVYRIKSGDTGPESQSEMQALATAQLFAGAELLLAGCTEIPLVLAPDTLATQTLYSTDLLVEHTIELARGNS